MALHARRSNSAHDPVEGHIQVAKGILPGRAQGSLRSGRERGELRAYLKQLWLPECTEEHRFFCFLQNEAEANSLCLANF